MGWINNLNADSLAWLMLYFAALEWLAYLMATRIHGPLACILRGHWYDWETVYRPIGGGMRFVLCRRCRKTLWF